MWSNNTGDANIEGDQIEEVKYGHDNINPNILFKIETGKLTTGHDFTLVKWQIRVDFRKYCFSLRKGNERN